MRNTHPKLTKQRNYLLNQLSLNALRRKSTIDMLNARYAKLVERCGGGHPYKSTLEQDTDIQVYLRELLMLKLTGKAIADELRSVKLRIKNTQKKFEKNLVKSN
jgi:hypothetical protein